MTLEDLLVQQFKVKTKANVNPEVSVLTGGVDKLLSNNPNRLAWFIINMSSNVVYLGFDRLVSSSKGVILSPSGGTASMIWNEDFDVTGWELFAKGTVSDNVYVVEILTTE